jgi:hypothetical protein
MTAVRASCQLGTINVGSCQESDLSQAGKEWTLASVLGKERTRAQTSNACKQLLMVRLTAGEYLESGIIWEMLFGGEVEAGGRNSPSFRNDRGFVGPEQ